jgi:hypothetical protein
LLCAFLIWLVSAPPAVILEHIARQGAVVERVTLFPDGMVVWHSRGGTAGERLVRQQLFPEEMAVYLDALTASKIAALKEGDYGGGMEGPVMARWTLRVTPPGVPTRTYTGSGLQAVPLEVGTVLAIADDLRTALRDDKRQVDPFDAREPRVGDILVEPNGDRWTVCGTDPDHGSLHFQGIDQPLTRYVKREDLKKVFKGYADLPGNP